MNKYIVFIFVSAILPLCPSCKNKNSSDDMVLSFKDSSLLSMDSIQSPKAPKIPHSASIHGIDWVDDYFWMRLSDDQKSAEKPDASTIEVLKYLEAENEYREKMMKPLLAFEEKLFEEIKGRIKQTDMSVPYKYEGYYYITRFDEGKEYPVYTRKKENLEAAEEVLVDVNELAKGFEFFTVGSRAVSPDNTMLAYSEDNIGRRQYTIKFKNLTTDKYYSDEIINTTGGITWGNDNKTIFYSINDDALRSYKIFRHVLGTDPKKDHLVFHEKDATYATFIFKTKSKKFLVIGSSTTLANEYQILEADNPSGNFRMFQKREKNLEFDIDHYNDNWYIRTNKDDAQNFKIMSCPLHSTSKENWVDFIPYEKNILTDGFEIFKDFMIISERKEGLTKMKIRPWNGQNQHYVSFDETVYTVYPGVNPDFDTPWVRLEYSSLTTPNTTYDYHTGTKELKLMKQQEVLGTFDPKWYVSERKMVKATDGTNIPLSIVYKKGFKPDGTRPVLLYGYGSYGYSMDPYFSSSRLSLLNRGFAFAIAHVRGGQEMGRQWYEDGKYFKKKNTFSDFINCGEYLIKEGYVGKDKLFAQGGSAGGLLMGAVINMKPEIWRGVIAQVPFVDVVNTMLDESIPLTTGEFDEWGNPKNKEYFDYMRSYSPYDNIEKKDYPAMLVTTGYWDSQVQYWEPAKWVAKLRDFKTDNNPILMYCNMDTGHGGASGRFKKLRETAMEYAFLLDLAGLGE